MEFYCKELDKTFNSVEEMFKALREAHKDIIASKKAKIYNCDPGGEEKCSISLNVLKSEDFKDTTKAISFDDDYYYIAVNTTKILDSHGDVHQNGIWNKTAKEQQGKVYLVWDHELKGGSTIVKKEDIEMMVIEIPFSALKMPYVGNTEALVYKFRKDKVIDVKAKEWLQSGDDLEASVRMQYVNILFALNSKEDEDKEFKANYDKYIKTVANKDDYKEIPYFWPVLEAKNILESSLVLFGSNHVTGQIETDTKNTVEPEKPTQQKEPSDDDTQTDYLKLLLI